MVYGVGLNDADYNVNPSINGKRVSCPYYSVWSGILERCYSEKMHEKNKTYKDCTVQSDWLVFSNFKIWMESQDWIGKEIDKDLLIKGNKHYSEHTCVFISSTINSFLTNCAASRGSYPIGVSWSKSKGKFVARCRNPILKKCESLGSFKSESEAAQAWLTRKRQLANILADQQSNKIVADALRRFYE